MVSSWIRYVHYSLLLGGGFAAGLFWGWNPGSNAGATVSLTPEFVACDHDVNLTSLLNEQRGLIHSEVQLQIAEQLNGFKIVSQDQLNHVNAVPKGFSGNDAPVATKEFSAASSSLADAIASGGFDANSAAEFLGRLNRLPPEEQFELRAKQMDAFNKGLISSPLSPEEIVMQASLQASQ